jgi:hypothetical protein
MFEQIHFGLVFDKSLQSMSDSFFFLAIKHDKKIVFWFFNEKN